MGIFLVVLLLLLLLVFYLFCFLFWHLRSLSKLHQYLNRRKLQIQLLYHLSCHGWTTATVACGGCQRTSYLDYSEFRAMLQELSLKQRGQITLLSLSMSYKLATC